MTRPDLERLRALCEAATPGPWCSASVPDLSSREDIIRMLAEQWVCGPDSVENECLHVLAGRGEDERSACVTGNGPDRRANARFIAAARNALPALLDEVEWLRAENDRLRAVIRRGDEVDPQACALCPRLHETICDRCSKVICFGCLEDDVCVECAMKEGEGGGA